MQINKTLIEHYSWIVSGSQRSAVVRAVTRAMTPSMIRKLSLRYNSKITLNNTSDILRSFVDRGLAVCLNPDEVRGRLYQLTELGVDIQSMVFQVAGVLQMPVVTSPASSPMLDLESHGDTERSTT